MSPWPGMPSDSNMVGRPMVVAMAPVISAAARTRAHVCLMFLPYLADYLIRGIYRHWGERT